MRVALLGSKSLAVRVMHQLRRHAELTAIVTVADEPDARSRRGDFEAEGATVVSSRAEADDLIRGLDADLIVVAGWYWLIPKDAIRRKRFVGIHHSLLPAYRGGSPLVWALIEGQEVVGTSLFTLTDELDGGPIWAQAYVPALDGYIGEVQERCDDAAIGLLPVLFESTSRPVPQNESGAFTRRSRRPSDGLIDWTRPAMDVLRWIRAQSRPYPGAFTYRDAERLTIWRASAGGARAGAPGEVRNGAVACGDGQGIVIEEATLPLLDGDCLQPGHFAALQEQGT